MKKTVAERFSKKVECIPFSGCWVWMGFDMRDGYGGLNVNGTPKLAHRISWKLHRGEIPSGMCVLHRCDVACCVNPDHLFLGTQQENIADKVAKNRQAKGERHGMSKLSDADVKSIGVLKNFVGMKAKDIAPLFGVTPERIWQLSPET